MTTSRIRPLKVVELHPDLSDFELFWECYPKKKSKGDAFKAWKQTEKIRPRNIEELIARLETLMDTDDWQKNAGQFIPYPATWLRNWGWEDE